MLIANGRHAARAFDRWERDAEQRPEFDWTQPFQRELLIFLLLLVVAIALGAGIAPLWFRRRNSEENNED